MNDKKTSDESVEAMKAELAKLREEKAARDGADAAAAAARAEGQVSAEAREEARKAAIREFRNRGYKSGNETRKPKSDAHAEFLIRAGA